ncbi:hypothetical protein V4S33_01875 [Enterococcus cecorum]
MKNKSVNYCKVKGRYIKIFRHINKSRKQLAQLPDNTKVQETVSQEFVAQYTQIQSQLATLTSQLTHAQHAQQVAEEKLNQFEQQHPELFAQTKATTSPKPLLITGFVGVLLSLLLMKFSPLFGGLVFVSTILLVGLLYLRVYRALDSEPIKRAVAPLFTRFR